MTCAGLWDLPERSLRARIDGALLDDAHATSFQEAIAICMCRALL
jgi:hypothetical protein